MSPREFHGEQATLPAVLLLGGKYGDRMAKREEIYTPLVCPECGSKGTTISSENENPVSGGGLDERFERVEGPFEHHPGVGFQCKTCGQVTPT